MPQEEINWRQHLVQNWLVVIKLQGPNHNRVMDWSSTNFDTYHPKFQSSSPSCQLKNYGIFWANQTSNLESQSKNIIPIAPVTLYAKVSNQPVFHLSKLHSLNPKEATSRLMLLPFQVHGLSAHDQQELFKPSSPGSYLILTAHVARPFLRCHDPSDHPIIDPQYLSHPMDAEILCHQEQNLQALAKRSH